MFIFKYKYIKIIIYCKNKIMSDSYMFEYNENEKKY